MSTFTAAMPANAAGMCSGARSVIDTRYLTTSGSIRTDDG